MPPSVRLAARMPTKTEDSTSLPAAFAGTGTRRRMRHASFPASRSWALLASSPASAPHERPTADCQPLLFTPETRGPCSYFDFLLSLAAAASTALAFSAWQGGVRMEHKESSVRQRGAAGGEAAGGSQHCC